MNGSQCHQRRGVGVIVLVITVILIAVGVVVLQLSGGGDGRKASVEGLAPVKGNASAGAEAVQVIEPVKHVEVRRAVSWTEVDQLLKLASGDIKEQYEGFSGLRRVVKEGMSPDIAKRIIECAQRQIGSDDKNKIQVGIRLIEVVGDWRYGESVLSAWVKNRDDKEVAASAEVALANLLRVREKGRVASLHPEWSPRKQEQQGVRSALSQGLSCGSDPAKWRELWKSVMAEPKGAGEAKPVDKPEPQAGEAPAGAPADSPPSPSQP